MVSGEPSVPSMPASSPCILNSAFACIISDFVFAKCFACTISDFMFAKCFACIISDFVFLKYFACIISDSIFVKWSECQWACFYPQYIGFCLASAPNPCFEAQIFLFLVWASSSFTSPSSSVSSSQHNHDPNIHNNKRCSRMYALEVVENRLTGTTGGLPRHVQVLPSGIVVITIIIIITIPPHPN